MFKNKNIFTSGWEFEKSELNLRSKFQMINVALLLSSVSLIFGILSNVYKETFNIIPLELFIIAMNGILFFYLRKSRDNFKTISFGVSLQYSFFFLYLYYAYPPEALKFIWLFTYPIILLYFQEKKYAKIWMFFVVSMLLIAPLQPFVPVYFSLFQAIYLSVVLVVVGFIITFYQNKMDEARELIFEQQLQLQHQIDELTQKDRLLTVQSKQAVMGEMISMIAHQWRQPLSTVTLSVSDIQVKKMLGTELSDEQLNDTLQEISDTVVYLSETIDDFQTYFNPNKEIHNIGICSLIDKAINFTRPRLKGTKIEINYSFQEDEKIQSYPNELIQVILNILNNAMDELEQLEQESLRIEIELVDKGDFFILSITDNANGINSEYLDSIFEPYYSTKGKNGTGLGLYMSQMIMEKQFNSKIEVSSSKDGSCFSMRVPKKLS